MGSPSRSRPWFATVLLWIGTAILIVLFLAGGIQKLTAALITLDMVGGVITTLRFAEDDRALLSLSLLAIAVLIGVARWPQFWGRLPWEARRSMSQGSTST
jgi:hypothetical protein